MNTIQDFLGTILGFLGTLPFFIVGLALVVFLWKLMRQMNTTGNVDSKGLRGAILLGIIILFVMTTVWGIVIALQQVFFPGALLTSPAL
jgi:hypothetical protein